MTPEGQALAAVLAAYEPWCAAHRAPLRFQLPASRYGCGGWDGEGCPTVIAAEAVWGWATTNLAALLEPQP